MMQSGRMFHDALHTSIDSMVRDRYMNRPTLFGVVNWSKTLSREHVCGYEFMCVRVCARAYQ